MTRSGELLTESEARQMAEKLLLSKFYESKITFSTCQLSAVDDTQTYRLHGELATRSRSWLDRFTAPEASNTYRFKLQIDAKRRKIMSYEIT
jgi:hypothetical protein